MPAVFPAPADPVSAFTRPDGTTKAHSNDHGRVIGQAENVMAWGAKGDGVTNDQPAIQAALDSGARAVFFPPGAYLLAEGSTLTPQAHQRLFGQTGMPEGASAGRTTITSKNAYAISRTTGSVSYAEIDGLSFELRSGSTTGGAIKLTSGVNGVFIRRARCGGVSTGTTPAIWLDGWIGGAMEQVDVRECGGDGILVASDLYYSNHWRISDATVSLNGMSSLTAAGLRIVGGRSGLVEDSNFEGNRCYGIYMEDGNVQASSAIIINRNWFENNRNTDIEGSEGTSGVYVTENSFQYLATGFGIDSALRHIKLTTNSPSAYHHHVIGSNFFGATEPPSGIKVEIGAEVLGTYIYGNRRLGTTFGTSISDSGKYTSMFGNASSVGPDPAMIPIGATGNGSGGIRLSRPGTTALSISGGVFSPEGNVTAPVGSLYLRSDGGAGTVLYVKESGTSVTGWVAK